MKYPLIAVFFVFLTACGGDGGSSSSDDSQAPPPPPTDQSPSAPDENTAVLFLNRATFGSSDEAVAELIELGYENWLDEQMSLPGRAISFGTNFLCLANYSAHKSTKISLISCTSQKFSF